MMVVHIATAWLLIQLGTHLEYSKKADLIIYLMSIAVAFVIITYGIGQLDQIEEGKSYF